MDFRKNVYYEATMDGRDVELAIRSEFKGDFNAVDFCICQIREREKNKTTTRYRLFTLKELRAAFELSPRQKITIKE